MVSIRFGYVFRVGMLRVCVLGIAMIGTGVFLGIIVGGRLVVLTVAVPLMIVVMSRTVVLRVGVVLRVILAMAAGMFDNQSSSFLRKPERQCDAIK